jgi:peptidoglycan/xylan/chitin deacetylase (PgdA/CDA1 family)
MAGYIQSLPAKIHLTSLWRKLHTATVPVLMFHGVLPDADTSIFNSRGKLISPGKLRSFIERIMRIYRIVPMEEFVKAMLRRTPPANMMVLTFDDGYENVYKYAYPVLKEMGLPFTVFVSTGFIDTDAVLQGDLLSYALYATTETTLPRGVLANDADIGTDAAKARTRERIKGKLVSAGAEKAADHLDWICEALHVRTDTPELDPVRFLTSEQIREMAANGVVFGGHTVTHPILSRENVGRIRSEVRECKDVLESLLGGAVEVFAYPNGGVGDFNDAVKRELREAGYIASFTTIHGLHRMGDDLFEIRRIGVDNGWSYEEFETRASGILKAFRR